MKCHVCGCTETTPCIDAAGVPCAWVTAELCSACFPQASCGIDAEAELDVGAPPILEIRVCPGQEAFGLRLAALLEGTGIPADVLNAPATTVPNEGSPLK